MTKWIGVLIFLFFISNSHAQTDSLSLQATSSNLLQQEISFSYTGGKLAEALQQLSQKQLKFSYSDDRIAPVSVSSITISDIPLYALMDLLLENTKFTYLVVGRIILIVEDETPETDTTEKTTSSPVAVKPESHIYTPNSSEIEIPPKLKRTLDKLYHDELKWAAKRGEIMASPSDTVISPKQSGSPWDDYFLTGGLGVNVYTLRTRTNMNLDLNWEEELGYKNNMESSIRLELVLVL